MKSISKILSVKQIYTFVGKTGEVFEFALCVVRWVFQEKAVEFNELIS